MEGADERGGFNQEVVDEELPADVNRNDFRRIDQVRRRDWARGESMTIGRPRVREPNAVVERGRRRQRLYLWRPDGGAERARRGGSDKRAAIDAAPAEGTHQFVF